MYLLVVFNYSSNIFKYFKVLLRLAANVNTKFGKSSRDNVQNKGVYTDVQGNINTDTAQEYLCIYALLDCK